MLSSSLLRLLSSCEASPEPLRSLNIPPNQTGLVAPQHLDAITGFGAARNASFGAGAAVLLSDQASPIELSCGPAQRNGSGSGANSLVLNFTSLSKAALFDTLVTMEDLSRGQRIAAYALDAFVHGQQAETGWQALPALGQTVGHKVIDVLPFPMPTAPVKSAVEAVRFTCLAAAGGATSVYLKGFGAFLAKPPPGE